MDNRKVDYNVKFLVILSAVYELIIYFLTPYLSGHYVLTMIVSILLISAIYLLFIKKEKRNPFYIIFFIGLIIRTYYILSTSIYVRQHDVGDLTINGHLNYIYFIFHRHHLPMSIDCQFYHPPLWYFIGAIWIHFNNLIHYGFDEAFEGLQILTLLLSLYSVIIVDKITVKLKLKNKYRYLICLLIAIHPTMIIFSGSINNDPLLLFLELLIILLLMNFYEKTTWKNTICLALATGFCVMTKSSGAVMAVPILYVFIVKLINVIKSKKNGLKQLIFKIISFGLIALPIGLWHPIRNIIKFSTTKIPDGVSFLYIGDKSLISRFLIPNVHELLNYVNIYEDYNLPTYLIKSSLFGEFSYDVSSLITKSLLIINTILIALSLIFIVKYLVGKKKDKYNNILVITWFSFMIAMYIFNYYYPFRCSMDFRYIPICIFPSIAILFNGLDKIKNEDLKKAIEVLCYLFSILSVIFILCAI